MKPALSYNMPRSYSGESYGSGTNTSASFIKQKFDNLAKKIKVKYMEKNHGSYTDLRIQRTIPLPKHHENPLKELAKLEPTLTVVPKLSNKDRVTSLCINNSSFSSTITKPSTTRTDHFDKTINKTNSSQVYFDKASLTYPSTAPEDLSNSSMNNYFDYDIGYNLAIAMSPPAITNSSIHQSEVENKGWFKGLNESRITMDSNYFSYNGSLDSTSMSNRSHFSSKSIFPSVKSMISNPKQSKPDDPINDQTLEDKIKIILDVQSCKNNNVYRDTFLDQYFLNGHIVQIQPYLYMSDLESAYCEQVLCKLNIEGLLDVSGMSDKEAESYLQCKIGWGSTVFRSCTCSRQTSHNRAKLSVDLAPHISWLEHTPDCLGPQYPSFQDRKPSNHHSPFNLKLLGSSSQANKKESDETANRDSVITCFRDINKFLEHYKNTGKRILVFCKTGRSRAPTVIVQHLMYAYGMSLRRAYNLLKRLCPAVEPKLKIETDLQITLFKYERLLVQDELILPMVIKTTDAENRPIEANALTSFNKYVSPHKINQPNSRIDYIPYQTSWFPNGDTGSGEFLEGIKTNKNGVGFEEIATPKSNVQSNSNHVNNKAVDRQIKNGSNKLTVHKRSRSQYDFVRYSPKITSKYISVERVEDSGCYL